MTIQLCDDCLRQHDNLEDINTGYGMLNFIRVNSSTAGLGVKWHLNRITFYKNEQNILNVLSKYVLYQIFYAWKWNVFLFSPSPHTLNKPCSFPLNSGVTGYSYFLSKQLVFHIFS
jgi:hypothetical protein